MRKSLVIAMSLAMVLNILTPVIRPASIRAESVVSPPLASQSTADRQSRVLRHLADTMVEVQRVPIPASALPASAHFTVPPIEKTIVASTVPVSITESGFDPAVVTITVDTTVAWTNRTQEAVRLVSGEPYRVYFPLVLKNAGESGGQTASAQPLMSQAGVRLTASEVFSGTLAPGESYTHTFTTDGDYPYFLSGYLHRAGLVVVQRPLVPDFALGGEPLEREVVQGKSVTYTVAVTALHGFDSPVALAVGGLPTSTTVSWATNSLTPTASGTLMLTPTADATLTITPSMSSPTGTFALVITGAGGDLTHTADITLTVLGALPDLTVESIQTSPAMPVEGQQALITVTLRNQGGGVVEPFETDWYVDPPSPPGVGDRGVFSWTVTSIGPGDSIALTTTHVFTLAGDYALWAQADTLDAVVEDDESNNVTGPVTITVLSAVQQVCGTISEDTIWHSGVVYVVTCDVTVQGGVSLTVEPDAIIKFGSGRSLHVNGNLVARGTAANPVYITSTTDDTVGGDTNSDGSATSPAPGDWGNISLGGGASITFDFTTVRYSGDPTIDVESNGTVVLRDSTLSHSAGDGIVTRVRINCADVHSITVERSTIVDNAGGGIYMDTFYQGTNHLIVTNSIIRDNGNTGIWVAYAATLEVMNNQVQGNGNTAIVIASSTMAQVTDNVLQDNSGYALWLSNSAVDEQISGNTISGNQPDAIYLASNTFSGMTVFDAGVPYVLQNISVASGQLPAGAILKFMSGSFIVKGSLHSQGTAANPVYITSIKDDTVGGDTNGDGSVTSPAPGDWGSISLSHQASLTFDFTTIRYSGDPTIDVEHDGTVVLRDSTLSHSAGDGIVTRVRINCADVHSITVERSTIADNASYGIYMDTFYQGTNHLIVTNSIIRDNGNTGIWVAYAATGIIRNTNIYNNDGYGVYNASPSAGLLIDGRYIYWGSDNGPAPYGSGDAINTYQQWDPVCECYVTRPAVIFSPWLDSSGNVVGPPPQQTSGSPSSPASTWVADPVNVVFGNYSYQYTDLAFPTLGEDFAFRRTYNSGSSDGGPLGSGWTHSYHITVTQTSTNTIVVQREDGRKDMYTDAGGGNYLPPPGIYDILNWDTDHFVLTRKDQAIYTFDPDGTLTSITDRNGNTTTLTYSGANLITLTEPTGRQVTFTYSANLLTQISDLAGRTVSFGYTSGRLTSVTDVNGQTTTYAYDGAGRLQSITDANSHTFVHNTYGGDGRVIEQLDALNNLTTFSYYTATRQTTVTDPRGFATVYEYDSAYRVIAETDPLGNAVSYAFDANNNRTQVTDKRGNSTNYAYDSRGNVLTIADSLGGVTTFTYDDYNNLLSETDALDNTTSYQYDASHNLTGRTDGLNNHTSWVYNSNGQVESTTDALGNTTAFAYDTYGYQATITDSLGYTTVFTYDIVGRLLNETDAAGRTITYTYDAANHLLAVGEPLGKLTTYAHDSVGNRTTITDARGGVITFAYDEKDHLVSVIDPLSHITTYGYDAVNNQTAITNALGHATTYGYDALNRRASVTDPLGNTTTYQYDPNGNRTHLTDANGNATQYTYDALNRLVSVTDAESGTVTYAYDTVGNRTTMADANSHTTTYAYDTLNRLISVTDPLSYTVIYTYNAVGNRTGQAKADGTVITYTYDALDRPVGVAAPGLSINYAYDVVGNRTWLTDTVGVTTYTYDALNRLTQVTAPTGTLQYAYDAGDNRINLTYPDSEVVTYTYDLANRLTNVTDWIGQVITYTYDDANRQTRVLYPNDTQATYTYDDANRLLNILHTSPVSSTIAVFTYTLDAVGNRLTMQDLDGTTSYAYDDLYRLTQVTYPDSEQVTYVYDPMGNRTAMTSTVSGVVTYTYNASDRLLAANSITFTWDANGRMIGKGEATYTFDALDRLTQVVSGTTMVQFVYNGDGVRVGKTANSVSTQYVQDIGSPLPVALAETMGGQTSLYVYGNDLETWADPTGSPTFYHNDGLGSVRALSNLAGQRTDTYSYDVFGSVRSHIGSAAQLFTFTGEQADDELGLTYLRVRYYDPSMGRFLSLDPLLGEATQGLNRYIYVANRPTIYADPSGRAVIAVKLAASAHWGLGGRGTATLYLDPDTGRGCVMVAVGGGAGIGGGGTLKIQVSPSGSVPQRGGFTLEAGAGAEFLGTGLGMRGGIGAQGGFDVTAGPASVGISDSGNPRAGLKVAGHAGASGNLMYSWIPKGWSWSDFQALESRLAEYPSQIRDLYNLLWERGYLSSNVAERPVTQSDSMAGDLLGQGRGMGGLPSGGK